MRARLDTWTSTAYYRRMHLVETYDGVTWSWRHAHESRDAATCRTRELADRQASMLRRVGLQARVREAGYAH